MNRFDLTFWRKLPLLLPVLALVFVSCNKKEQTETQTGFIFNPVDTVFNSHELIIPGGQYEFTILFSEGDPVKVDWKSTTADAKGSHDFMAFIPIKGSSKHGILWVNHESTAIHDVIGDGGGATVVEIYNDSVKGWSVVGFPYAINFDPVGGTLHNCLGVLTSWGTVLTSEEIEPMSNSELYPDSGEVMMRDTSDYLGLKRWKNYGWMVEVDPHTRKVLGKRYAMGRFMHEGNAMLKDDKTFYMMDDEGPGVFFKFVADTARNLNSGRLFAFRHEADSMGSHWISMPRGRDSLLYARNEAFRRGASIFNRLEDIELLRDGTFLITESGQDSALFGHAISLGGKVMPHLSKMHLGNNVYDDKHGRILRFDPKTDKITVFLEGGQAVEDKSLVFSNPDNMVIDTMRNLLVIHEDINDSTAGRVPARRGAKIVNEIYFLDLNNAEPKLDDLRRFAVLPMGAESTGPVWSPDFSSLFFNVQVEKENRGLNPSPFNRSFTVVVTGFPPKTPSK